MEIKPITILGVFTVFAVNDKALNVDENTLVDIPVNLKSYR